MSAPLVLDMKSQFLLSLARKIPIADVLPFAKKHGGPDISDPAVGVAMPSYDRTPVAAAQSLLDLQNEAKDRLSRLSIPVLVQHGRYDHTAPVRNARMIYDRLRTPHRKLVIYPKSWHILPLDIEHEDVERDVLNFINEPHMTG